MPRPPLVSSQTVDARAMATGDVQYVVRSDACMPDARRVIANQDPPGLGGHLYGRLWSYQLTPEQTKIFTIPTAEMAAWFMSAIINAEPLLAAARITFGVDALATPTVLASSKGANTESMRIVHECAMRHRVFKRHKIWSICHAFGDGNPVADACSRGRKEEAETMCRRLGFKPRWVAQSEPAFQEALVWLRNLLGELQRMRHRKNTRSLDKALPGGDAYVHRILKQITSLLAGIIQLSLAICITSQWLLGRRKKGRSPRTFLWQVGTLLMALPCANAWPRADSSRIHGCAQQRGALFRGVEQFEYGVECIMFIPPPISAHLRAPPPAQKGVSLRGIRAPPPLSGRSHALSPRRDNVAIAKPVRSAHNMPARPHRAPDTHGDTRVKANAAAHVQRNLAPPMDERQHMDRLQALGATAPALAGRVRSILGTAQSNATALGIEGFNEDRFRDVIVSYVEAQHNAPPPTTLSQENSNWKWWTRYCHYMGWPEVMSNMSAASGQDVALFQVYNSFVTGALLWIYERMPSARGKSTPPKPSSALQVLMGIRRIHLKRLGLPYFVPLSSAVLACDGLVRSYMLLHGPEALQPDRKEPLTREIIVGLIADSLTGLTIGVRGAHSRAPVNWTTIPWAAWRALVATMAQTGFRKADVSLDLKARFGLDSLTAANLVWSIAGVLYQALTMAQLLALKVGDYAMLRAPPSKADQFGLHWGACTIYLAYHPTEPINAARELAKYELARALPAHARRHSPLFVNFEGGPWRHNQLDALFHDVMQTQMSKEEVKKYSMHSFRVYLACALKAAGASNAIIQALLRWRSESAMKIYARLNDETYAGWLSKAAEANVSSVTTGTMLRAQNSAVSATDNANTPGAAVETIAGARVQQFQSDWLQRATRTQNAQRFAAALPELSGDTRVAALQGASTELMGLATRDDGN